MKQQFTFKVDIKTTVTRTLKINPSAPVINVATQRFKEMFGEDRVLDIRLVPRQMPEAKKLDFDYGDLNWSHWGVK